MEEPYDLSWAPKDVKRYAFLHDALFNHLFSIEEVFFEFASIVLREAFGIKIKRILSPIVQKKVDAIVEHSIVIDAYCELEDGTRLTVEAQNSNKVDHNRRIRFYQSMLTINGTPKGAKYADIPNVCMIYIVNFDYFGYGRPFYVPTMGLKLPGGEFVIPDEELEKKLDNGVKIVVVNATAFDDSPVGRLVKVLAEFFAFDDEICPAISAAKDAFLRKERTMEEYMSDFARENYDTGYGEGFDAGKKQSDAAIAERDAKLAEREAELAERVSEIAEINALSEILEAENRGAEFFRATREPAFRAKLIRELFPNGVPALLN